MSTDSTELTFIRCPSCRSLVPAVSPRCRMCGAVLDAAKGDAAASSEESAKKSSSRVRQQTVLVSDQDVQAAKEAFGKSDVTFENSEDPNFEDPLGSTESPSFEDEAAETQNDEAVYASDSAPDFGDPLGAFIEEVPAEEAVAEFSDPTPVNELDLTEVNGNGYHEEVSHVAEPVAESVAPITSHVSSESKGRQRVVVETGSRRSGIQRGGLSLGKSRAVQETQVSQQPRADQSFEKPAVKERPVESFATENKPSVRLHDGAKPVESTSKGRLHGWLVSYLEARGVASELREGKFFVSRSSLKGSDLILDDDSISTPHALVNVSLTDGLWVQDLMSDRGVFVRKRTGEAYQRVLESTKVEHGDWVRFGDVEFLVTVIPVPVTR